VTGCCRSGGGHSCKTRRGRGTEAQTATYHPLPAVRRKLE